MEWYYAINQTQNGPVSAEELDRLVQSGTISADTLVWKQGLPQWMKYSNARGTFLPPGRALCAECSKEFSVDDLVQYQNFRVCAQCKPIFFQRVREGAALPSQGSVWRSGKTLVMNR